MVTRLKLQDVSQEQLYDEALKRLRSMQEGDFPQLDALMEVITDLLDCPFASIAFQHEDNITLLSAIGGDIRSIPKKFSFSRYIIEEKQPLIVEDASLDPRFKDSPYVTAAPYFRFFIGIPLCLEPGKIVASLCILDTRAKPCPSKLEERLKKLAQAVEGLLLSQLHLLKAQIARERAQLSEHLSKRREEMLKEVAKVSGVGGWELDVATQTLYWTKKTREIHGVDDNYIPTLKAAYQFYAPEAQKLIEQAVQEGLKNNGIWAYELPFITAQGQHLWVKATGQAIYENGELVRLVGGIQDITQFRQLEERMRQNEQLAQERSNELNAIIVNMRHGIAVFGANNKLKYWNQQCIDFFPQLESEFRNEDTSFNMLEILDQRGELGITPQEFMDRLLGAFSQQQDFRYTYYFNNGKIIDVLYSPLPEGGWISMVEDITEREIANQKIAYAAHHDTMTGLVNRTRFNQLIAHALQRTQDAPEHNYTYLLLIDLDYFKPINDTYGHLIGDEVLIETAQRLKNGVRATDEVARLGGDEFAILMFGHQPLDTITEETAKRLLYEVQRPYHLDGLKLEIGLSIGVARVEPHDESISDVIKRADLALYSVKHQGRKNYCIFSDALMPPKSTS